MNTSLIPLNLERYLQMTAEREQVVSANMANIDTPGYHAKDVSFEQTLLRAGSNGEIPDVPIAIRDQAGLLERPDGNNVNLDHESLLLAKAQLQYGLGAQLIKGQFHELLSAVHDGSA